MSLEDDVLALLRLEKRALDDDEIAQRLGANRHYINTVNRRLEARGQIIRAQGPSGKILNRVHGIPEPGPPSPRTSKRKRRAKVDPNERVSSLIARFDEALQTFERSNTFPGPSLYFHEKAIQRRRTHASFTTLARDECFFEYVYAMLPAWGMHRMGKQAAKVGDFNVMVQSFRDQASRIEDLFHYRLDDLRPDEVRSCVESAWEIIAQLRVSTSGVRITAGSKALHHVLPDLVPPIDRQYTWQFFTGESRYLPRGDEKAAFHSWFPLFCEIAATRSDSIGTALDRGGFMATSIAKIVDNAIMGYMQMLGEIEGPSEEP